MNSLEKQSQRLAIQYERDNAHKDYRLHKGCLIAISSIILFFVALIVGLNIYISTPQGQAERKKNLASSAATVASSAKIAAKASSQLVKQQNEFLSLTKKTVEATKNNIISNIEVESGNDGKVCIVKLTISDVSDWDGTDTEKKEFINAIGKTMDRIGQEVYNETTTCDTQIYSPSGLLLGERTIFGNAKINN